MRISDIQLRSIIEREETGLKGWDGGPLAPRVWKRDRAEWAMGPVYTHFGEMTTAIRRS